MITKEAFMKGLFTYVDAEVMPSLNTTGKIISGTMIHLAFPKISNIVDSLSNNAMVKSLGIIDDNGMIDSDSLITSIQHNVNKYGKLEFDIPFVGKLKFCSDDVVKLGEYMRL